MKIYLGYVYNFVQEKKDINPQDRFYIEKGRKARKNCLLA